MYPKLLILGHCRHGKDTFAEILRDNFGFKFQSSSQAASDIFIYKKLKDKYNYENPIQCFEDRVNHRSEWYNLICEYNKDDRTRLAKDIMSVSDCYVGMRDILEVNECINQNIFDLIIWIDASERLPLENENSFNIEKKCADIIVENNGTYEDFYQKVIRIGKTLISNRKEVF